MWDTVRAEGFRTGVAPGSPVSQPFRPEGASPVSFSPARNLAFKPWWRRIRMNRGTCRRQRVQPSTFLGTKVFSSAAGGREACMPSGDLLRPLVLDVFQLVWPLLVGVGAYFLGRWFHRWSV